MKKDYYIKKNRMRILLGVFSCAVFIGGYCNYLLKKEEQKRQIENMNKISELAYKDLFADYDDYVKLIALEIEESQMNNSPIDVFAAYITLQSNGLISLGDEFEYQNPTFEQNACLGISVAVGEGVCRNQADNLYNVFKELDFDCGLVVGEAYENTPSGESNHAVVYVKDGEHIYLFDPTNKTIYLRNFSGKYISINNEDYLFLPNFEYNEIHGYINDDYSLYFNINNEYRYATECKEKLEAAIDKSESFIEYFSQYEIEYLLEYEKIINEATKEYQENMNEITNQNMSLKLINE